MLGLAIAITSEAFKNVKDKSGQPYILHCLRVMNGVDQRDSEKMQAAIMHDLVEDTDYTIEDLRKLGFSERVLAMLVKLTHTNDIDYETYIKGISLSKDATEIKRADLIDNSNITRLKGLRKADFERIEKYHKAFVYLS